MAGLDEAQRSAFLASLDILYRRSKAESRALFPHLRPVFEEGTHEKD